MLVLAGVSLNATIGENGIVTRAQDAKNAMEKAQDFEALQIETVKYSADSLLDEESTIDEMLDNLLENGVIDWVDGQKDSSGKYIDYNQYEDENGHRYVWVKKNGNSYRIFLNDDNTYAVDEMPLAGGGTLRGGTYAVTQSAFASGEGITDPNEKGKFTIEGDTKVIFNEPLGVQSDGITASGDMLSIYVKEDSNVKIYFNANDELKAADGKTYYKLTNSGLARSAIDIEANGSLEIVVAENVDITVDSGVAEGGTVATAAMIGSAPGGPGGFAGIHVPEDATLKITGAGTITAYGGNAGDGGLCSSSISSGGRGAGGGGGGYPAAGIGGGGAGGGGGDHISGGGGFTGGNNESTGRETAKHNGLSGNAPGNGRVAGGGYFEAAALTSNCISGYKGGGGGTSAGWNTFAGDGGTAGRGGNVNISEGAAEKLKAYNGSYITQNKEYSTTTFTTIYAQSGTTLPVIKNIFYWTDDKEVYFSSLFNTNFNFDQSVKTVLQSTLRAAKTYAELPDITPTGYGQGVGSGAGYIEMSNGTYTVN